MMWSENRRLLTILGILLAVNIGFFLTYRVRYQQRVEDLEQRKAKAESDLMRARNERRAVERQAEAYREVESGIQRVYNESWSTPEERLTPLILELRSLARKSDLQPTAVTYNRDDSAANAKKTGGATEMTVSFSVTGRYDQVRRLINLIEISRQFVVIDQIGLGDSSTTDGSSVALRISLRTLFRENADAVEDKTS